MAIEGRLPFYKPLIARDEIAQLVEAVESGWLTTSPKTLKFEAAISRYVGSQFAGGGQFLHRGHASGVSYHGNWTGG